MMQCVIVKGGSRCQNNDTDYGMLGIMLPIVKPEATVFICIQCLDEMHYVAHLPEQRILGGLSEQRGN